MCARAHALQLDAITEIYERKWEPIREQINLARLKVRDGGGRISHLPLNFPRQLE